MTPSDLEKEALKAAEEYWINAPDNYPNVCTAMIESYLAGVRWALKRVEEERGKDA